ncbi:Retrovirus-related Pol polyprotein from transposon RE2 [Vitis vinifera]|uniref:Retrovirus-related Pol polyprotein from transposon RE2 n=1 Tax=Vitis vinifera TaxID=29760 RepID=A0A438DCV3_VITVI|nr:Retrovirus-related Pol polyprotein from transposon RE2 [Vitis vinifera]
MGVSELLQTIKARADELAILGTAVDDEDLLEKILEGLGEDYKELVRAVQARDTPISFDELHEKLLNFEASLQNTTKTEQSYFPASANPANPKRCPSFKLIPIKTSTNTSTATPNSSWQPKAHFAANTSNTPTWLLDSGASHHVTSNLSNLSIHAPYNGSDDIMIGDGTGLPITHTGSLSIHTSNAQFSLTNVLCVPSMKKNLISISKLCISNNVSIEFLPSSFLIKDLRIGATLLKGKTKDGVYEWSVSSPLLAFPVSKPAHQNGISDWDTMSFLF